MQRASPVHLQLLAAAAEAEPTATCRPPRLPASPRVPLQSTAPASWSGDLLVLGVCEEAFETVGDEKDGQVRFLRPAALPGAAWRCA